MNDQSAPDEAFALHPKLAADCLVLGDLPVSRILLMNDQRFPWCILVPRLAGLRELHDLPCTARLALFEEIEVVSQALLARCNASKINVGALGNLVPQLHVHVVGRSNADPAWPRPVWGFGEALPYPPPAGRERVALLRAAIQPALAP